MTRIETERLLLRLPVPADADDLAVAVADPQVMRYIGSGEVGSRTGAAESIERFLSHWRADGLGQFAVVRRGDGRFLGRAGFLAWDPAVWRPGTRSEIGAGAEMELGWLLRRDAWGEGYATEAALALRGWAWDELALPRLVSLIDPANGASKRVAEKIGERYERDVVTHRGVPAQLWSTALA